METKLKSVWILTYVTHRFVQDEPAREIYGVYSSEDAANDGLNDGFLHDLAREGFNYEDECERIFDVYDPEITEYEIIY